jgi:hypothetical protein
VVQTRKQITVSLENKPGRLANLLSELARQKVNIVALSVMDRPVRGTAEHSVLRLVTDDEAETFKVIQASNLSYTESDVLAVDLKNQPGALAHVCETLAAEHINIEHAYCSSGGRNGKVFGIFKVSSLEKAQRVLAAPTNNRRVLRAAGMRRTLRDQRAYKRP